MAHFYIAQDTGWDYYFEVCDDPPGACSHSDSMFMHRTYTWGKDSNTMSIADMVKEIKALEATRLASISTPPANLIKLTTRGTTLEGQGV